MTTWSDLTHAYGSAEDIPGLFEQLDVPGDHDQAWEQLWSALWHQGTVYSASFAALTPLAALAADDERHRDDRLQAAGLGGAIMSDEHQMHDAGDVRRQYAAEISQLHKAAQTLLDAQADHETYTMLLQTILALEGVPIWGSNLEQLLGEEYEVECPGCETSLFIALGSRGYFSTAEDYALQNQVHALALHPADPAELQTIGKRLYDTAHGDGQATLAEQILHLFGTASCTECGAAFTVADQVTELD
ncbi:hypothetical protein [Actinomadura gamaensis]|uniref:Uncharacterized protein n=1 Tax=Actinomadura gamaensis TaxID=1763541 RepID=A0ABV9U0I6_9ACTN